MRGRRHGVDPGLFFPGAGGCMSLNDEFGLQRKQRRHAEINVIPMIDMLFFLLVFFVLTSSFTSEAGIDISKPKAQSAKTLPKQPLLIGVTRDGNIHVNESPVSLKALGGVLRHYLAQDPNRSVVIVADRDALISKAVDVLDECNLANVKKVSISTLKE
jgi:biopolymer transport protein ExbD